MDDLRKARDPRVVIVGSITGNTNSIGGGFVWPRASLGDLKGLAKGGQKPIAMIDGATFNGAKAYKDSKVRPETCLQSGPSMGLGLGSRYLAWGRLPGDWDASARP